ncbi:hypothetical protein V7O67_13850 [Methanolobus sp. ZRKC4]
MPLGILRSVDDWKGIRVGVECVPCGYVESANIISTSFSLVVPA